MIHINLFLPTQKTLEALEELLNVLLNIGDMKISQCIKLVPIEKDVFMSSGSLFMNSFIYDQLFS